MSFHGLIVYSFYHFCYLNIPQLVYPFTSFFFFERGGRLLFHCVSVEGVWREGSRQGRRGWKVERGWAGGGLPPGLLGRGYWD